MATKRSLILIYRSDILIYFTSKVLLIETLTCITMAARSASSRTAPVASRISRIDIIDFSSQVGSTFKIVVEAIKSTRYYFAAIAVIACIIFFHREFVI